MFKWLQNRTEKYASDSATSDLSTFVQSLRGMDSEELGMVVAIAAVIRMNLRQAGRLPDEALDIGSPIEPMKLEMIRVALSRLVREFQKLNQPTDAVGAMVWVHSLRALRYPPVRLLGREMWKELTRGMPHSPAALGLIRQKTGNDSVTSAYPELDFVPSGLEPRE